MDNFKFSQGPSFAFNLRDAVPQSHQAFKHSMGHALAPLAENAEKYDKQTRYGLGSDNSLGLRIVPGDLLRQGRQARSSILTAFSKQNTARKNFAQERAGLVGALLEQEGQAAPNALRPFKAAVSVLPSTGDPASHGCCDSEDSTPVASKSVPDGCGHDHEGGQIAVDLDEAAHGAFAVSKHLSDVANGNPQAVAQSFQDSAAALASEPVRYLGKELTESGVGEFASAVGAAGVVLPLAAMAVKAGINEWQHGSHELKHLRDVQDAQSKELDTLMGSEKLLPGKPMQSQVQAQRIRLEKTQEAIDDAHRIKQIGISSAGSGLFIGLKGSSDIALKTSLGVKGALTGKGFFALNESAQTGTAAAGAAVGLGVVSTLVVSPLAGVFAAGLGAFFTAKSVTKLRQLRTDFDLLKAELRADTIAREASTTPEVENLRRFLIRQGDKRVQFFGTFARWNQGFMVGSGLYASSAMTKAVVTGLAIGGVTAAASNPVGLAVISGVGIVGATGMGIGSLSFFRGHGKQSKYSRATAADHEWVDRRLMTDLHAMRLGSAPPMAPAAGGSQGSAISPDSHPGFDMAGACLSHLDTQKAAVKDFLKDAAKNANKHSPLEKNLTWWQHMGGRVLREKEVKRFLESDGGAEKFKALVSKSLVSETKLLTEKITQRQRLFSHLTLENNPHEEARSDPGSAEVKAEDHTALLDQVEQLRTTIERLDKDCDKDQGKLEVSLLRLKEIQSGNPIGSIQLAGYIGAGENTKEISKFLRSGFDREIRKARGVLFESQLEGARVHELQYKELTGTASAKYKKTGIGFWRVRRQQHPAPAHGNLSGPNTSVGAQAQVPSTRHGWMTRIFSSRRPSHFKSERVEI